MNKGLHWQERHVLSILPHPDDEAFGFSGTLMRYRQNQVPVSHVCATLGEMGRNMGQPPIANRETLPLIRKGELYESLLRMGVDQLYLLGRHDKMLEFEDLDELADQIGQIMEAVNPSVIYTFYPGLGVHQDHDALSWAVVRAVSRLNAGERPRLLCRPVVRDAENRLGPPHVVHDVSDLLPQKIAVISAHQSQVYQMIPQFREQIKDPDSELSLWFSTEAFWEYPL